MADQEEKYTYDDSVEFLFNKEYLGKVKFNSGWQLAFLTRYTSVCSEITKIKRKDIEDRVRILDLGCSNKTFWQFWSNNFDSPSRPRIDYVGLEYRQDIVDKANVGNNPKRVNQFEVLQWDLDAQPLTEVNRFEKYDVILMMEIIEHLHEDQFKKRLREAKSMLSDRGFIVVSSPNPKKHEGQEFVWPENHIKEYALSEMREIIYNEMNLDIMMTNGWLGKANYFKRRLDKTSLDFYNNIRSISSGFGSAIIAYMNPEVAECYSFFCRTRR